jgi:hypothetical protein
MYPTSTSYLKFYGGRQAAVLTEEVGAGYSYEILAHVLFDICCLHICWTGVSDQK